MPKLESKNFNEPDEVQTPPKQTVKIVKLGDREFKQLTYQPGWRWSIDLKPIAKTKSCQVLHVGYQISGQLHVKHDGGGEIDIHPGDMFVIPPGHDGWTVGDEPAVAINFD